MQSKNTEEVDEKVNIGCYHSAICTISLYEDPQSCHLIGIEYNLIPQNLV